MSSVLVLARAPYAIPQWARGFEIRTQLLKADGTPLPLPTGANAPTVRFTLAWTDVTPAVLVRGRDLPGTARIVDGPKGVVSYTVQDNDFARTGGYRAEFWIESVPETFAFPVRRKLDLRIWKTLEKL